MKLNRKELKKIQYDFNSISSRLLQVDVDDFHDVLNKFLKFLDDTQLISDYITFISGLLEKDNHLTNKDLTSGFFSIHGMSIIIAMPKKIYMLCKFFFFISNSFV